MKYWNIDSDLLNQLYGKQYTQATTLSAQFCIMNSQQVFSPKHTIFFGFKGSKQHGNQYAKSLYESGVRMFVLQEDLEIHLPIDAAVWYVSNTTLALQKLAVEKRKQIQGIVIGITGSYGKTMVKQWFVDLARPYFDLFVSPGSYNSQIGVSLAMLQAPLEKALYIFEAGISMPMEMEKLAEIIQADIGIFTGLGKAHIENFKDEGELLEEKMVLFRRARAVISPHPIPHENVLLPKEVDQFHIHHLNTNLGLCLKCLWYLGTDIELSELPKLSSVPNRLQLIEGKNQNLIIQDSHSADLESLQLLLEYLDQFKGQNTILIISDFEQFKDYELAAERINAKCFYSIITIGKEWKSIQFDTQRLSFQTKAECAEYLSKKVFHNSCFAIKGARSFQLESLGKLLESKGHTTILEVNEEAIRNNIRAIQTIIGENELIAMVKANAYGAGLIEVSKICESEGVDSLGVAYLDEAKQLLSAGIQIPIMVIQPTPTELKECFELGCQPEIATFSHLEELIRLAKRNEEKEFAFHIKVETGMNRLGYDIDFIPELTQRLAAIQNIHVISLVSHLAMSDSIEGKEFTLAQLEKFQIALEKVQEKFPAIKGQILNTSGILNYSDYQFDCVRTGIALLGLVPSTEEVQFQCAVALKAQIAQIRTIEAGDQVSYGGHFIAKQTTTIAVLRIGYADGLPRQLSNQNYHVKFQQYQLPIIGNICMDMCMVDISSAKSLIKEGDYLNILSNQNDVHEIATIAGTIEYDIVSRLGQRVKRIFSI